MSAYRSLQVTVDAKEIAQSIKGGYLYLHSPGSKKLEQEKSLKVLFLPELARSAKLMRKLTSAGIPLDHRRRGSDTGA